MEKTCGVSKEKEMNDPLMSQEHWPITSKYIGVCPDAANTLFEPAYQRRRVYGDEIEIDKARILSVQMRKYLNESIEMLAAKEYSDMVRSYNLVYANVFE